MYAAYKNHFVTCIQILGTVALLWNVLLLITGGGILPVVVSFIVFLNESLQAYCVIFDKGKYLGAVSTVAFIMHVPCGIGIGVGGIASIISLLVNVILFMAVLRQLVSHIFGCS